MEVSKAPEDIECIARLASRRFDEVLALVRLLKDMSESEAVRLRDSFARDLGLVLVPTEPGAL